ncbi:MAG: hypothetical protein KA409_12500 [Ferruginibacter sp.]|nr:hypothetical protein [Chitinophagaceae bacterium]MBP6287733.1 hypothetical protein [Ferruginibacter sp.]
MADKNDPFTALLLSLSTGTPLRSLRKSLRTLRLPFGYAQNKINRKERRGNARKERKEMLLPLVAVLTYLNRCLNIEY